MLGYYEYRRNIAFLKGVLDSTYSLTLEGQRALLHQVRRALGLQSSVWVCALDSPVCCCRCWEIASPPLAWARRLPCCLCPQTKCCFCLVLVSLSLGQRVVHLTAAIVSTAGLASASFPTNFTANQALLTATVDEFETTTGLLSVDYPPTSVALVRLGGVLLISALLVPFAANAQSTPLSSFPAACSCAGPTYPVLFFSMWAMLQLNWVNFDRILVHHAQNTSWSSFLSNFIAEYRSAGTSNAPVVLL